MTVRALLMHLRQVDGWVLSKGWEDAESADGDVDLLVRPADRARIEEEVIAFLSSLGSRVSIAFRCTHVPGVPRIFALAPAAGFVDSLLEVDLAELIPLRGYPFATLDRLMPFVVRTGGGVPRLRPEAAEVLRAASRLGWFEEPPVVRHPASAVLERLLPRPARAVWAARWLGPLRGTVLTGTLLGLAVVTAPRTVLRRIPFRLMQTFRGRVCPFDPRLGRDARRASDLPALHRCAVESGHEVAITHGS